MRARLVAELRERAGEVRRGLRLLVARGTPHRWRALALLGVLVFLVPIPGPFEEIAGCALLALVARKAAP